MKLLVLLLLLLQDPRGTATLIVRDEAGQPIPGVRLVVFRDTDVGEPEEVATIETDAQGTAQWIGPYGLYVVQFIGALPDGRPFLPTQQQNRGGALENLHRVNGFGIWLQEQRRTDQFVVTGTDDPNRAMPATPMFDQAPSPDAPAQPLDPATGVVRPVEPPPATPGQLAWIWAASTLAVVAVGLPLLWLAGAFRRRKPQDNGHEQAS